VGLQLGGEKHYILFNAVIDRGEGGRYCTTFFLAVGLEISKSSP